MLTCSVSDENPNPRTRLLQNGTKISNVSRKRKIFQKGSKFPKSIYMIVGNEFCERYSFYALRTILALYLSSELSLGEDTATSVYHGWSSLCFCTPLIGAVIADSFLGRFRTITYISFIYILGSIILALSAIHTLLPTTSLQLAFSATGLILIAFGTGGIKSCVAVFGGDQFDLPDEEEQLTKFFYVFYFAINAGGAFSSMLSPIFREDVTCFGGDCYPLAFGVPALLMILSLGIFVSGWKFYKISQPDGNIIGSVFSCIYYAAGRRIFGARKALHWLDLADDKFSLSLVHDIKCLLRVLFLLIPVPLFWTLFDQQSTRWMFQATRMTGATQICNIKPDQIQVLNPVMILILIPIFDNLVYPTMKTYNIFPKPLQRMILGGVLTAAAFFVSGFVQTVMENHAIDKVPSGKIHVEFINAMQCNLEVSAGHDNKYSVSPYDKVSMILEKQNTEISASTLADDSCVDPQAISNFTIDKDNIQENQRVLLIAGYWNQYLSIMEIPDELSYYKTNHKQGTVRIITVNLTALPTAASKQSFIHFQTTFQKNGVTVSDPCNLDPSEYYLAVEGLEFEHPRPIRIEKEVARTILIHPSTISGPGLEMTVLPWYGSELSMLWLLPQYFLISVGEMFFVITGLEFIFKEAPDNMKSIVQAAWLFTVALGNFFMMIVAEFRLFQWQSHEFFLFGTLMLLDMLLFYYVSRIYESTSLYIYHLGGSSFPPLIYDTVKYDSTETSEEEMMS